MTTQRLVWENKYSVGVKILDQQHQQLFKTINDLLEAIHTKITEDKINKIISDILQYKIEHFQTEEQYFKKFNYENTAEHIALHNDFNEKLQALKTKHRQNIYEFSFALVDFLEDWLIAHLMDADQKYIDCFKKNGVK